jgi:hypothetical protein
VLIAKIFTLVVSVSSANRLPVLNQAATVLRQLH